MNTTPQQRLDVFIRSEFRRKKDFAEAMEMRDSDLTKYTKNGKSVFESYDKIRKLSEMGLNLDWYFNGEGEMLAEKKLDNNKPSINHNGYGVPYYPTDVTASIVRSFDDIPAKPQFYIDFEPFNECTAYFTVFGDSMYPKYASGEIVAVKQIFNKEIIWWGEAYLVVTDESADNMRTVKLLFQDETDPSIVILRASNPNYRGDVRIPKTSILGLFIVKGKITRNML